MAETKNRTPFGDWVVERLAALGLEPEALKTKLGSDYLRDCVLYRYPHERYPLPRTIDDLAALLEVAAAVVRARLAGQPTDTGRPDVRERLRPWVPRLAALFEGHAEVKTLLGEALPEVVTWPGALDEGVTTLAEEIRPSLEVNQPQLLVEPVLDWSRRPLILRGVCVDFAIVAAMRRLQRLPVVLSASAVVCTADPVGLVLHRRANLPHTTYANCLHTLGGAFHPDLETLASVGTDRDLHDTLVREVFEESRLRVSLDGSTGLMVEEPRTGFIQLLGLGVTAPRPRPELNAEGMSELVRPEHLLATLLRDRWVPTGRLAVLLWLAAGAPGFPEGPIFGGLTVDEVLEEVVATAPLEHVAP